jgi:nitrous oxidase accessory protein NosD
MGDESSNSIVGNQIANNDIGTYFLWMGDFYSWKPNPFYMNNSFYNNNFINNNQSVVNGHIIYTPDCANIWDNGISGNYWSNYNGTDNDGDGIGDTPYVIDANNQDNYPLMSPVAIVVIPEFPTWTILPLLLTATLVAIICKQRLPKTPKTHITHIRSLIIEDC